MNMFMMSTQAKKFMWSYKMISKRLQKITILIVILFGLCPSISVAKTFGDVWPEANVGGVLIISGDDGEEVDRTTTCTNAGQRYPVIGNFEYDLIGFTQSGNVLTYTQLTAVPRRFFVDGKMTAKGDVTGTYIHFSVYHNGSEIFPRSITGIFMKTANQAQGLPGFAFLVDLEQNDTLEIRTWSDSAGEGVTLTHFNYVIFPIGRQHH